MWSPSFRVGQKWQSFHVGLGGPPCLLQRLGWVCWRPDLLVDPTEMSSQGCEGLHEVGKLGLGKREGKQEILEISNSFCD